MKRLMLLILVSVFCLLTSAEAGQIYQWIDKNGVRHFTNEPPPPGAKVVNKQTAIPYNEAADQKRTQEDQEALERDSNQQESQQTEQQEQREENRQETPGVQADDSDSNSNSNDTAEGVFVEPYNRDRVRRYQRRRQEGEGIVTPLPRRDRMDERRR